MPSLVIANTSLASGGIARIKHSWTTANTGEMSYSATYACLAEYATKWITSFTTGSQPPLPLPSAIASIGLTRIPDLAELGMDTANGLTYFDAKYTAGVAADVTITQSSEVRNISWVSAYIGNSRIVSSFDYISNSVRITGTNTELPVLQGSVGAIFNTRNVDAALIAQGGVPNVSSRTIQQTSSTRNGRGEYINNVTSTGIYVAYDAEAPATNNLPATQTVTSVSNEKIATTTAAFGSPQESKPKIAYIPKYIPNYNQTVESYAETRNRLNEQAKYYLSRGYTLQISDRFSGTNIIAT